MLADIQSKAIELKRLVESDLEDVDLDIDRYLEFLSSIPDTDTFEAKKLLIRTLEKQGFEL